jgi:hypothetical protein
MRTPILVTVLTAMVCGMALTAGAESNAEVSIQNVQASPESTLMIFNLL